MVEEKKDEEKPELKEVYEKVGKNYGLPDYDRLAEDFDVNKCDEDDEDFMIRNLRRVMGEKVNAYLHFFEVLINPASPPVYIYTFLKSLDTKHKESIKEIYKVLSIAQVKLMQLDTIYDEKKEAEFISKFFEDWQDLKKDIYEIMEALDSSFDNNSNANKRSYLG